MTRAYQTPRPRGTIEGWVKEPQNPVLGGAYGTCFDVSVMDEDGLYKMWFSWRPVRLIGYVESVDGIHWSQPIAVLKADLDWDWQNYEVNRPCGDQD